MNKQTLETKFPGVYAVGDVNGVGTPKAGVFAEGSAQVVAAAIVSRLRGGPSPDAYKGQGSCYVEFGHGRVGRVDVDFLSGPKPRGTSRSHRRRWSRRKRTPDRAGFSAGSDGRRRCASFSPSAWLSRGAPLACRLGFGCLLGIRLEQRHSRSALPKVALRAKAEACRGVRGAKPLD